MKKNKINTDIVKSQIKKRFKMYKSKKNWIVVPILFFGILSGIISNSNLVLAKEDVNSTSKTRVKPICRRKENRK